MNKDRRAALCYCSTSTVGKVGLTRVSSHPAVQLVCTTLAPRKQLNITLIININRKKHYLSINLGLKHTSGFLAVSSDLFAGVTR